MATAEVAASERGVARGPISANLITFVNGDVMNWPTAGDRPDDANEASRTPLTGIPNGVVIENAPSRGPKNGGELC
jgi:hypothetical protein